MKANAGQATSLVPEELRTLPLPARDVVRILEQHREWLDSRGEAGIQADLSRENLEGADLIDARLQNALLNKTNLKRAELILADVREASLLQANLEETSLLGTQFQGANLQAAILKNSTGLVSAQLAGTNLFGAVLPETISPSENLKTVVQVAARTAWFLTAFITLNLLVWLRIFTTRDAQLIKNAPALPFFGLQADLPFIPFYLFGPVAILGAYVWFHLYLQRLWDGTSQLPSVFPDGRTLDTCLPWFARWPAQMHCKWLRDRRSPLAVLEAGIAILLLYWIAPVTAVLFWGRYLTLEDLRGSFLHVLVAAGAIAAALILPKTAGRAFAAGSVGLASDKHHLRRAITYIARWAPLGSGLLLLLLSVGTIAGVPHDSFKSVDPGPAQSKRWAAQILWLFGYNPFAQLIEADVSTKPPGWSGLDEDLSKVSGANLNRRRLQFIQAYGAFLAKAHLWRADLRNAYLSEADLREANLRQADLQFAILDGAQLRKTMMQDADLRGAVLDRADLQQANLSSGVLSGGTLLDAKLDGANLYKADLRSASLQRASLKRSDLREANLENANLSLANLQEAYLSSTKLAHATLNDAVLAQSILEDANLRGADLNAANLEGAVLRGADFTGANLESADLRGAVGLAPKQICSAASFAQAQLDESLQTSVDTACGSYRSLFPVMPRPEPAPGNSSTPRPGTSAQSRLTPAN